LASALALAAAGRARAADAPSAASLMRAAERALRSGRPNEAAGLFERASRLDDVSATAELGMMRSYLQAGDYAHALAWGRLVAGEHRQSPEAEAWADAVDALARPAAAKAAAAGSPPLPGPATDGQAFDAENAERLGCGLLDAPHRRLLMPPALAQRVAAGAALPWIVDGTGTPWRMTDAEGSVRCEAPAEAEPTAAGRAPAPQVGRALPGRPVLLLHPAVAGAWPRLAPGLLTFPAAGERLLGLASAGPAAPEGSPVFDACGRWLGWAVGGHLEPAAAPGEDATSCRAGPGGDVASIYGQRYATAATVWRPA
jgi:hypothetical protein